MFIFASLNGAVERVKSDIREASIQGANGIELRVDGIPGITKEQLEELLAFQPDPNNPLSKLITIRHKDEAGPTPGGGFQRGDETERTDWYNFALKTGLVDLVDIEHLHRLPNVKVPKEVGRISSYHIFHDPFNSEYAITDMFEIMEKEAPDIIKIVAPAYTERQASYMNNAVNKLATRFRQGETQTQLVNVVNKLSNIQTTLNN